MKDWNGDERRKMTSGESQNLKTFMEGEFKLIHSKLNTLCQKLEEHHTDLYGSNSETPGIKLKVDRLEQSKKNSDKHVMVIYSTATALILKSIYDFFTGQK